MDLEPFLAQLRRDLTAVTQTGTEQIRAAATQIVDAIDPAARLVLLDVLVTAADELSEEGGTTVEVRLRGRDVDLVAHSPAPPEAHLPPPPPPPFEPDDGSTARVSLRLPEAIKSRAEARASADGVSLNTWLVRAVISAVDGEQRQRSHGPGTRLSGWARS